MTQAHVVIASRKGRKAYIPAPDGTLYHTGNVYELALSLIKEGGWKRVRCDWMELRDGVYVLNGHMQLDAPKFCRHKVRKDLACEPCGRRAIRG